MARTNLLREKLAAGKTCFGPIFQEFWSAELFEFCGLAGFDYLIVDGEHAAVDPLRAKELARAGQGVGVTVLARVPRNEPSLILQFLDAGVEGLILPHCNSAADAEAFVSACKYPPRGIRGASSTSRAAGYGFTQRSSLDHVAAADQEVLCLGLIEEPRGVENLAEILAVDGLDGCWVGFGDLALALGREYYGGPGIHPEVQKLVDRALDLTIAAGKLAMIVAPSAAEAPPLAARGVQLLTLNFGALVRRGIDEYLGTARG
jgi:4-hydroxy-2-oxoheptanedioate aldolase